MRDGNNIKARLQKKISANSVPQQSEIASNEVSIPEQRAMTEALLKDIYRQLDNILPQNFKILLDRYRDPEKNVTGYPSYFLVELPQSIYQYKYNDNDYNSAQQYCSKRFNLDIYQKTPNASFEVICQTLLGLTFCVNETYTKGIQLLSSIEQFFNRCRLPNGMVIMPPRCRYDYNMLKTVYLQIIHSIRQTATSSGEGHMKNHITQLLLQASRATGISEANKDKLLMLVLKATNLSNLHIASLSIVEATRVLCFHSFLYDNYLTSNTPLSDVFNKVRSDYTQNKSLVQVAKQSANRLLLSSIVSFTEYYKLDESLQHTINQVTPQLLNDEELQKIEEYLPYVLTTRAQLKSICDEALVISRDFNTQLLQALKSGLISEAIHSEITCDIQKQINLVEFYMECSDILLPTIRCNEGLIIDQTLEQHLNLIDYLRKIVYNNNENVEEQKVEHIVPQNIVEPNNECNIEKEEYKNANFKQSNEEVEEYIVTKVAKQTAQRIIAKSVQAIQQTNARSGVSNFSEFKYHDANVQVYIKPDVLQDIKSYSTKAEDKKGLSLLEERFMAAIENGIVGQRGEVGIKSLNQAVDGCQLAEVKILGHSNNGQYKIGDMRLVCMWDQSKNFIYAVALTNHKDLKSTITKIQKNSSALLKDMQTAYTKMLDTKSNRQATWQTSIKTTRNKKTKCMKK